MDLFKVFDNLWGLYFIQGVLGLSWAVVWKGNVHLLHSLVKALQSHTVLLQFEIALSEVLPNRHCVNVPPKSAEECFVLSSKLHVWITYRLVELREVSFDSTILSLVLLSVEELDGILEILNSEFKVALIKFIYTFEKVSERGVPIDLFKFRYYFQSLLEVALTYLDGA